MGQIESTGQNEAGIVSKETEEKENKEGNDKDTEDKAENKQMLHCVKNRIDMLIEGCLLSKEPNDLWVPDKLKKNPCDWINKTNDNNAVSENPKDADNGAEVGDSCADKTEGSGNADADVSKNANVEHDNKVNAEYVDKEKSGTVDLNEKMSVTDLAELSSAGKEKKKEIEIKIEDSKCVKVEETIDTTQGNGRTDKIKVADLISEISKTDTSVDSQKKKLTTFQTFIDQVLDNSLQHVNATMKVEKTTNILELCSMSMNPSEKQTKLNESIIKRESSMKTESISESNSGLNNNEKTSQNDKNLTQKCEKGKPTKSEPNMISLKDHIERFLELSFQEKKPSEDENQSTERKTDQARDIHVTSKSGNSENFNAQGLVNNMISQGLQINKLLSPSAGKGREAQKSPNIRSEQGEMARREVQHVPWPYDERHLKQNPSHSGTERINVQRQHYMGKYNGGPQRSPNGSNPGFQEVEQQRNYLIRPKVEYPDYKGRMYGASERSELVRDDHLRSQERYPGYPVHKLQKPVPNMVTSHPAESVLHPAMMYSPQFSPRHPLLTTTDNQKVHTIGMLQESLNSRGHKQPAHLRDCKCALCVSHPDPRFQAREHKSPEYPSKLALSPSPYPQFSPPHAVHPAYLTFQRLQNPQDQPPAMMRPSHSAVPPGCPGYQMPKLLPHHPPITSPKEYDQLQQNMPANMQANKNIHPSHRLSTEEHLSTEMYATYRPNRLDPNNLYQKRSKELEIPQAKTGGYLAASQRKPSPASRDDQRKEVQDILLSPEPRLPANDWARRRDCPSNSSSSSVSGEIPLDLSFKKTEAEKRRPSFSNFNASPDSYHFDAHRQRTQSFVEESHVSIESPRARAQTMGNLSQQPPGNVQRKGNMLFNTFIKHLESSVDKYCQDLKSSPPPGHPIAPSSQAPSKSGSPNEAPSVLVHQYQRQPSPGSGPHGSTSGYGTLSPRAPYAGGITLGQPILGPEARAHIDNRQSPKHTGIPVSSSTLSQPPSSVVQPQPVSAASVNYASFELAKRNNISKHEPIQNIIGNHDPNDILYLICRLCNLTYGSPYGFRKHFRNQHGFEPRAEDTIVQTISETKTALNGPNMVPVKGQGMDKITENEGAFINKMNEEVTEGLDGNTRTVFESPSFIKSNSSSQDSNSIGSEEDTEGERSKSLQNDSKETKYLECPECGKTFQLNDFGSYKRHCRQHGQVKMTGTLSCSKCHLSFADQQLLKDHYNVHVKESQSQNKTDKPVSKTEVPSNMYSCIPCEKTFDDTSAYQDHLKTKHSKIDGPPKLSPQTNLSNERTDTSTMKEEVKEPKWPAISLSVIPSHNIVKQAAESMTASACPDSSTWSENENKNVAGSSGDRLDEGCSENYDSVSVGSNSNLSVSEKINDSLEKSQGMDYQSQKSVDSSQDNTDDKGSEDGCEFQYKHKKFQRHRKRAFSNCSQSSDTIVPVTKQSKLSPPTLSRSDSQVSTCTAFVTNESADSTCSVDSKVTDSPGGKDSPSAHSPNNDLKTTSLDGSLKQEARHHLPFVWDRVTRSQVGRKTK